METFLLNSFVRLNQDLPAVDLRRGDIGIVRDRCPCPSLRFEVEFHHAGHGQAILVWLESEQISPEQGPLFDPGKPQNEEMAGLTD